MCWSARVLVRVERGEVHVEVSRYESEPEGDVGSTEITREIELSSTEANARLTR